MDAGTSQERQTRARYRHELRTLTYVTLDQANGGIVRNLTRQGMGLQVVAAVRPRQQLRVRFELRYPRVRVETRGEVMWATFSGQCGIRFLDLSPRMARQIQEWIFGDLLEGISLHAQQPGSIFWGTAAGNGDEAVEEDDGLLVSPQPRNVIELPERAPAAPMVAPQSFPATELDWLSQPLSGQSLAWTINTLVLLAGVLLFALVFLSVTRQAPSWPVALSGASLVIGIYWGFFQLFGGSSLGTRLARLLASDEEDSEDDRDTRFR
jgi:hypothetical protein